jgi:predicted aspartyl protease
MTDIKEQAMGRFSVDVELANNDDVGQARRGAMQASQVRRVQLRGVVDSGAVRLVIPEALMRQLGLETSSTAKVRYADGHTAERAIARNVYLTYGGREGVFNAIVEPARESILIGAIVLEDLDLLVDCTNQRLVPRDPKQIVSEIE